VKEANLWVDLGVALAIILAIVFLFMNLIFRVQLLKSFKEMQRRQIQMEWSWLFDRNKREQYIYPRYEDDRILIERFSSQLRRSLKWGAIIFFSLSTLAAVLIFT
jgi:hypothetical protein